MKGLEFDAGTHTYSMKGLPIPSVTQVIAGTQDFTGVSDDVLEAARERGRYVHEITAQYDLDMLTLKQLEPGDKSRLYLKAWVNFLGAADFQPILIEERVYSSRHRFAGTIDRIGWLGGERVVVDIKTAASPSRPHPAVGLQLAAYLQAYNEGQSHKAKGRYAVQLRSDGKYTLTQYVDKGDFSVFLACLTLHNWRGRYA